VVTPFVLLFKKREEARLTLGVADFSLKERETRTARVQKTEKKRAHTVGSLSRKRVARKTR